MQDGMERQGSNRVVIHTVDTDVVVLGISAVSQRDALKLFIAFGTQKNSDTSMSMTWEFS